MMKFQYQKWLNFQLRHEYFEQGNGQSLQFSPTEETAQTLEQFGILFREGEEGFFLLAPVGSEKIEEEKIKLSFGILAKDTYLLNYSALPLSISPEKTYHLSNRSKASGDYITGKDQVELRSKNFVYQASLDKPLLLTDEEGTTLGWAIDRLTEEGLSYQINLQDEPSGIYHLFQEEELVLRFYADDHFARQPSFGVVEFTLPLEDSPPLPQSFSLKIKNRKTTWRYYLLLKYQKQLQPEDIQLSPEDYPFEKREIQSPFSNSKAILLESEKKIPLCEARIPKLELKIQGKKKLTLPKPEVSSLNFEPISGSEEDTPLSLQRIFSDVFLYL